MKCMYQILHIKFPITLHIKFLGIVHCFQPTHYDEMVISMSQCFIIQYVMPIVGIDLWPFMQTLTLIYIKKTLM